MDINPKSGRILVQDAHAASIQIGAPEFIGIDAVVHAPRIGDPAVVRRDRRGFGPDVYGLPGGIGVLCDQPIRLGFQISNGQVSGGPVQIGKITSIQ